MTQGECEFVDEPLVEPATVGEAGQRVLERLPLELIEQDGLFQVGLGQRHIERVEVLVRTGEDGLPLALEVGLALGGGDLILDGEGAELVARRFGLHFVLELVEPTEMEQGLRRVADTLVIAGERLVGFVPGELDVVAFAHIERRMQPLARLVVARLRIA